MAIEDGDKNPQITVTSNAYDHVLTELDSVSFALKGSANTQSEVRLDGGDVAETGTLYVSSVGKTWQKTADNKVDADWTLFTGANPFDQDLNTTDDVSYRTVSITHAQVGSLNFTTGGTVEFGGTTNTWIQFNSALTSDIVSYGRGIYWYSDDGGYVGNLYLAENSNGNPAFTVEGTSVSLYAGSANLELNPNLDGKNKMTGDFTVTGIVNTTESFKVDGTKVVGNQGAAVADATGAGDVVAQLNTLLARLRTHGLIAT